MICRIFSSLFGFWFQLEEKRMFCSKCGSANDDAAKSCVKCGAALAQTGLTVALSGAQGAEPASDEDYYKAIIGPGNQEYYLERFFRFDDEGRILPTWNWSAFLVTSYWLLYRKMWVQAAIYFIIPLLLLALFWVIGFVVGRGSGFLITLGNFLYLAAVFVGVPMYANAAYYKHCKKMIAEVQATTPDIQRQLGELSGKGGTSKSVVFLVMFLAIVGFVGMLAAIAIPAYQDFTVRGKMAQAVVVGRSAEDYVDAYYSTYRTTPSNLEAADFLSSLPPAVKAVTIDSQSGTVTITMKGAAAIEDKTLKFVPAQGGNQLRWACMSDDILDRYLPHDCRRLK
jgi:Tfp pilus assembly protein PilE